jgi:hypothetical protein
MKPTRATRVNVLRSAVLTKALLRNFFGWFPAIFAPCRVEAVYHPKTGFVLEENSERYNGCPKKIRFFSPMFK